jgi:hypothetical protein
MSSSTINHAGTAAMNPLKELNTFGQSVWLDYMRRHLISSGELRKLVEEDGLGRDGDLRVPGDQRYSRRGRRSTAAHNGGCGRSAPR